MLLRSDRSQQTQSAWMIKTSVERKNKALQERRTYRALCPRRLDMASLSKDAIQSVGAVRKGSSNTHTLTTGQLERALGSSFLSPETQSTFLKSDNVLCVVAQCVQLFVTPWFVACQALLSMGILQTRILEWVAMPSSNRSFQPRV